MWFLNDWHGNRTRKGFWWQSDLGEYAQVIKDLNLKPGIRRSLKDG
jgi:hypothetical protein